DRKTPGKRKKAGQSRGKAKADLTGMPIPEPLSALQPVDFEAFNDIVSGKRNTNLEREGPFSEWHEEWLRKFEVKRPVDTSNSPGEYGESQTSEAAVTTGAAPGMSDDFKKQDLNAVAISLGLTFQEAAAGLAEIARKNEPLRKAR